jgi:hypothetical protein
MATKIQKKTQLRKVLHSGNFERIAIWRDGSWVDVNGGYGGEQDGNNPCYFVSRTRYYEPTHKMIDEIFSEAENMMREVA